MNVDVQALPRAEATALVRAVSATFVDGAAMRQLWVASQGNPVVLRELLLGARVTGALSNDDGVWLVAVETERRRQMCHLRHPVRGAVMAPIPKAERHPAGPARARSRSTGLRG